MQGILGRAWAGGRIPHGWTELHRLPYLLDFRGLRLSIDSSTLLSMVWARDLYSNSVTIFGKHCLVVWERDCHGWDLHVTDNRAKMLAFRRLCGGLRVPQSVQRGGMARSLLARGLSSESDAHLRVELLDDEHKGSCGRIISCKMQGVWISGPSYFMMSTHSFFTSILGLPPSYREQLLSRQLYQVVPWNI